LLSEKKTVHPQVVAVGIKSELKDSNPVYQGKWPGDPQL
jgi:hypothetical protein